MFINDPSCRLKSERCVKCAPEPIRTVKELACIGVCVNVYCVFLRLGSGQCRVTMAGESD